jgi:sterol desaturase/sphingolipid hydroxylase (fatty acid hydroxylase superfamily)
MVLRIFFYIATIFITHHIASFIQVSLHCLLGHRETGGFLYRTHLYQHHGIYSKDLLVSDKYIPEEKSLDFFYSIPVTAIALLAYLSLPFDLFLVHVVSMALSVYAHLYLHGQYHLKETWLSRFKWFSKRQQLHLVHHKNSTKNFAVLEFFWDRVLGTYQEAPVSLKS